MGHGGSPSIPTPYLLHGSSPRTRGTRQWWVDPGQATAVHPRMRWERHEGRPIEPETAGSSPHTRGTHLLALAHALGTRFIPAYAGNAALWTPTEPPPPVHPRIRGERPFAFLKRSCNCGSSPHARGTLTDTDLRDRHGRFIPACAGNADRPTCPPIPASVHPRMRGERGDGSR